MTSGKTRWIVRGDFDGFAGLFIDNLLQLLLILTLCPPICGIPVTVVVHSILPGAALSILVGNLFYSWQAHKLARDTGRDDVTALPYGINTVSLIAYIFLIMGPVWQQTHDSSRVWQAGVFACLASGVFEFCASFVAEPLRRSAPRAALLSALAGVAITFISMGFAFQIFASPAIALLPMFLIVIAYAMRARLPIGFPAGLAAILLGVIIAWALRLLGLPSFHPTTIPDMIGLHLPALYLPGLHAIFHSGVFLQYLPVIIPMSLFTVIGSLQTLESAEAAGDRYETRSSLMVNGIGSLVAGLFGSAFPTTLYIGHPGWKAMGARTAYSAMNGIVISALCFAGAVTMVLKVVPIEAALGILIWIGLVMTAQAFQATPARHAVAVAAGLVPSLAAWAVLLITTTLAAAGSSLVQALPNFGDSLYVEGAIALNQGFLITSMAFASIVAFAIDRRLFSAAVVCFLCAGMSAVGLIHAYSLTAQGIAPKFGLMVAPDFVFAYAATGVVLLIAGFFPGKGDSLQQS